MDVFSMCKSCRKCCIGSEIRIIDEDILRWRKESRMDILLSINPRMGTSRHLIKKDNSDECIFLKADGSCEIQSTKPYICRRFPTYRKQAESMGCDAVDIFFPILKV